jgi:hypothetical protein
VRSLLFISLAVVSCTSVLADPTAGPTPQSSAVPTHVEPQAWQLRRAEFQKTVQGVRASDPKAQKDFDTVLTEFETHAFSRTPIENLEIIGVFYMPKDGMDPGLSVVVANLVLGWYDALRFASESGRAEIVNNEGFFRKAFIIGGTEITAKAGKFLEDNQERSAQLVAQGISFAERFRETSNYDRHWPTAYGLEHLLCAQGGSCADPPPMPKEAYDKAWEDAKQRVTTYFKVAKPATVN